jgi:hypothetical protein
LQWRQLLVPGWQFWQLIRSNPVRFGSTAANAEVHFSLENKAFPAFFEMPTRRH